MPYNEDVFYLGYCKNCQQFNALKNGFCSKCKDKDIPDFMKDLFGKFDEQSNE